MRYALHGFGGSVPDAPDLLDTLERMREGRRDLRLRAGEIRFEARDGACGCRVEGEWRRLESGALRFLTDRVRGKGRQDAGVLADRLEQWREERDRLLVRISSDAVSAVLPAEVRGPDVADVVREAIGALRALPVAPAVEHCEMAHGELFLTLVCRDRVRELQPGDHFYGGFYLCASETSLLDTEACARLFRLVCSNGALLDLEEGQRLVLAKLPGPGEEEPERGWQARLRRVVERSFDEVAVGGDVDRLRGPATEILASPYEFLLHLRAQGSITADEQSRITHEFRAASDDSLYGLINAVTRIAHGLRDGSAWRRAFEIERLGGEILRGDHQPPVGSPVFG